MAGVLFVLYIPCDSEDAGSDSDGKPDDKRPAKGVRKGQAEDSKSCESPDESTKEESATESTPLINSDSGFDSHELREEKDKPEDDAEAAEAAEVEEEADKTEKQDTSDINSLEYFTLEEALQQLMIKLEITRDVWRRSDDTNTWEISFVLNTESCDAVMKRLISAGLGTIPGTSISTFLTSYHLFSNLPKEKEGIESDDQNNQAASDEDDELKEFVKSVRARLTVAQVVEGVKANAKLTFDYVALVILASIIAAIGLAENSSVVLVASMLVSPIMGPILGGTFGYVIGNRDLARLGLKNELIGLGLCLLFGFVSGIVAGPIYNMGANGSSSDTWPTAEMQGRGLLRGLGVGVAIALPSGAGVALSILGGNTGSLVGVAISASLLPPAVNAGMLWAYSVVSAFRHPSFLAFSDAAGTTPAPDVANASAYNASSNLTEPVVVTAASAPAVWPPNCPALVDNDYEFVYSCSMPVEVFLLGIVSLFLTVLNIVCIIVMSIVVLKIKEVAPNTADSKATAKFWKNDIPVARENYKTLKRDEGTADLAKIVKEFVKKSTESRLISPDRKTRSLEDLAAMHLYEELDSDEQFQEIVHLMPSAARAQFFRQLSKGSGAPSFGDLLDESLNGRKRFTSGSSGRSVRAQQPFSVGEDIMPKKIDSSFNLKELAAGGENKNTFVFEAPISAPSRGSRRTPRGYGRMNSCPDRIVIKPVKRSAGRFIVTTIPEEEHHADVQRRESAVDDVIRAEQPTQA